MTDKLETEIVIQQVEEKPGATGHVSLGVGFVQVPGLPTEMIGSPESTELEFFPNGCGIGLKIELDWSRFGHPRPAIAYYGTVYRLTLEAVSYPTEPIRDPETLQIVGRHIVDKQNGGLQRPTRRV